MIYQPGWYLNPSVIIHYNNLASRWHLFRKSRKISITYYNILLYTFIIYIYIYIHTFHIVELVYFFFIPKTFFNRLCTCDRAKWCRADSFSIVNFFISHTRVTQKRDNNNNNNINVRSWCVLAHILLLLLLLFKARDTAILGQRTGSKLIHGRQYIYIICTC